MNIRSVLDQKIEPRNLLTHPFYEAWSCGELPLSSLKTYAEEYGAFITLMPMGWSRLGDEETAQEEEQHIELWQQFAQGLGTEVSDAKIDEVQQLINSASEMFANPAQGLGALYAFEAQQPETAKSKLAGLKEFYELPASVEPYFETHSHNEHEAEKLVARIDQLDEEGQSMAIAACEQMSELLWDALTGIHKAEQSA